MNGDEEKYSPFTPTLSKAPFTRSRKPAAGVVSSRYEEYSGGCGTMVSVRMSLHRAALLSRAGLRRPRLRPASVPRRLRPNLKPFVILNEVDRRTQREQRPLADYAEQGGERQTQCSQESVYVYLIQILRRSAPQNDKLLNCSQTPPQTGICNWQQRESEIGIVSR